MGKQKEFVPMDVVVRFINDTFTDIFKQISKRGELRIDPKEMILIHDQFVPYRSRTKRKMEHAVPAKYMIQCLLRAGTSERPQWMQKKKTIYLRSIYDNLTREESFEKHYTY